MTRTPARLLVAAAALLAFLPWCLGLGRALHGDGPLEDRLRAALPGRGTLLQSWHALRWRLCATTPPTVVRGTDGWFYYRSEAAGDGHSLDDWEGFAPDAEADLRAAAAAVRERAQAASARGAAYLAVLVPDKHAVHPEHLPPTINRGGGPLRAERLAALAGPDALLDLGPALRAWAAEGPLWPRTDSHWHDGGAFAAYRTLHTRLTALGLRLGPALERDAFTIGPAPWPGDLARLAMAGWPDEPVETWRPRTPLPARRADRQPLCAPGRPMQDDIWSAWTDVPGGWREAVVTVDDPTLPTAVVFHDSFMPSLLPFLAQHFRRTRCVWHHHHAEIVAAERPDVVLHLHVARNAVFFGR